MTINWGLICGSLILSGTAFGSGFGVLIAGQAAIGAWKKCFLTNKPAPMLMLAFIANPVTQTFYAYILMDQLMAAAELYPEKMFVYVGFSLAATATLIATAIIQGKIAASAVESICETRKGFAHDMAVMGVAETVALFTMVFTVASL